VWQTRWNALGLWLAQTAHVVVDSALLLVLALCLATGGEYAFVAWCVLGPLLAVPAIPVAYGFFAGVPAPWRDAEARTCLVGLAGLRGVVTGLGVALILGAPADDQSAVERIIGVAAWVTAGQLAGSLLAGLQRHPRRVLGLVPWGATGLVVALAWAAAEAPGPGLLVALGALAGLVKLPLAVTYQAALPDDHRGYGMVFYSFTESLIVAVTFLIVSALAEPLGVPVELQLALLAGATALAALYAWWHFRREAAELVLEAVYLVMYRFRAAGPGLDRFPHKGPVLVIANHCAWLDPTWLGKVLPRAVIPMMTSAFFDLPVIRWIMVHLVGAIRVQAAAYRREAPELRQAIAALDRGRCVVLFPEGAMRRGDDRPLRMFGQGVWHILRERPETPLVVCWIEGGWGSYFSYKGGPPTRNKRLDVRRLIQIAVGAPHLINPELLADQRRTRLELMRECLQMRRYLGLDPLPLAEEELTAEAQKRREDTAEQMTNLEETR
jgi:1-acyl-sn-glycerol-3-phosphate acyltransferase